MPLRHCHKFIRSNMTKVKTPLRNLNMDSGDQILSSIRIITFSQTLTKIIVADHGTSVHISLGRFAERPRVERWTTVIQVSARSGMVHYMWVQRFKGQNENGHYASKVQRTKWVSRKVTLFKGSKDKMPPRNLHLLKVKALLWTLCLGAAFLPRAVL